MAMSPETFLTEVDKLIVELEQMLASRTAGVAGEGSPKQLSVMIDQFRRAREDVVTGRLTPRESRQMWAAYMVIDTWPNDSEVGSRIIELEHAYRDF